LLAIRLHAACLQGRGVVSARVFAQSVANALEAKLAPVWGNRRSQSQDAAWAVAKHRNLTAEEEWAMCCVFWEDFTCLGYAMPTACTGRLQTRRAICRAACAAFGIANTPATRDKPHCTSKQYQTGQIDLPEDYDEVVDYAVSHHRPRGCVWQPFCWREEPDQAASQDATAEAHATLLAIITYVGGSASIVCLVITIAACTFFSEVRTFPKKALVHLSAAMQAWEMVPSLYWTDEPSPTHGYQGRS